MMWPFKKKEPEQEIGDLKAQKEALEKFRNQRKQASEEVTRLLEEVLSVKPQKEQN